MGQSQTQLKGRVAAGRASSIKSWGRTLGSLALVCVAAASQLAIILDNATLM